MSGRGDMTFYPMGSYGADSGVDLSLVTYPYNPDRAMQLLSDAGYDDKSPLSLQYRNLQVICFGGKTINCIRLSDASGALHSPKPIPCSRFREVWPDEHHGESRTDIFAYIDPSTFLSFDLSLNA